MGFDALLTSADRLVRKHTGGPVIYTPGVGAPVTVDGIFDAAFIEVGTSLGEAGVASQGPAVFLTLTDLPSDPMIDEAARVTIKGVTYRAHTPKPDGTGGVVLLLHTV